MIPEDLKAPDEQLAMPRERAWRGRGDSVSAVR